MFCPQCGTEYLEGVEKCADCGVELTHSPPQPKDLQENHDNDWPPDIDPEDCEVIPVLNNPALLGVLKSVLESEGIPYFLHGEHYGMYYTLNSARLIVPKKAVPRVRELVNEAAQEPLP